VSEEEADAADALGKLWSAFWEMVVAHRDKDSAEVESSAAGKGKQSKRYGGLRLADVAAWWKAEGVVPGEWEGEGASVEVILREELAAVDFACARMEAPVESSATCEAVDDRRTERELAGEFYDELERKCLAGVPESARAEHWVRGAVEEGRRHDAAEGEEDVVGQDEVGDFEHRELAEAVERWGRIVGAGGGGSPRTFSRCGGRAAAAWRLAWRRRCASGRGESWIGRWSTGLRRRARMRNGWERRSGPPF